MTDARYAEEVHHHPKVCGLFTVEWSRFRVAVPLVHHVISVSLVGVADAPVVNAPTVEPPAAGPAPAPGAGTLRPPRAAAAVWQPMARYQILFACDCMAYALSKPGPAVGSVRSGALKLDHLVTW